MSECASEIYIRASVCVCVRAYKVGRLNECQDKPVAHVVVAAVGGSYNKNVAHTHTLARTLT